MLLVYVVKKIRIPPPPSTISSLDKVSLDMNFSCHFHIFFFDKILKTKTEFRQKPHHPSSSDTPPQATRPESSWWREPWRTPYVHWTKMNLCQIIGRGFVQRCTECHCHSLVLCGELKVPNLLDLQGRLSIRWRKLGWTFYFHCTDMTL